MTEFYSAKTAIFLVSTPLQVINAIEARWGLLPADCSAELVVLKKSEGSKLVADIALRIGGDAFKSVEVFSLSYPDSASKVISLCSSLLVNRRKLFGQMQPRCASADIVFVGNVMNREMLVAAKEAVGKIVVLDDGTSTAAYLTAHIRTGKSSGLGIEFSGGVIQRLLKSAVSRLAYGKYSQALDNPVFFTTYGDLARKFGGRVIPNNYEFMRAHNAGTDIIERVDFLGGPFVDRGDASLNSYVDWLYKAQKQLGLPIRYIAHWAESPEVLDVLRNTLGIECLRLEVPYEFEFVTAQVRPRIVATWFCSAFDVLPLLDSGNSEFNAFRVPFESFVNESTKLSAQEFYKRHEVRNSIVRVLDV